jgi:hypothetical protein
LVISSLLLVCTVLAGPTVVESLPAPVQHEHSFELLSNSRYSVHSGFTDSLPGQVLANVLWAMARAPRLGERELYVARRDNVWRYDDAAHVLRLHKAGDQRYNSGSAFEVGVTAKRHEDAGMAVQAGLLAGTAFRTSEGGDVVSCPMKWAADFANANWSPDEPILMVNVFGRAKAKPLDPTCVAISSDTSLDQPRTEGRESYEKLLTELHQDSTFGAGAVSDEALSQLLWAAYGPTPHVVSGGKAGLTVPSAVAGYPLTARIYAVTPEAVSRYANRAGAGTNFATRDHRLQTVFRGDRRADLALASSRLPGSAPLYVVVAVGDTGSYRDMQEAGFGAVQLLAQARSLGLAGWLTAGLSRFERSRIAAALDLPEGDLPAVVFACGEPASALTDGGSDAEVVQIVSARPAIRRGSLQVDYWTATTGDVRVEVFDMLGRPVRLLSEGVEPSGYHSLTWDGADASGRRLKRGTYLIVIFTRGATARHKVTLG